jgi:hypothetical protein
MRTNDSLARINEFAFKIGTVNGTGSGASGSMAASIRSSSG